MTSLLRPVVLPAVALGLLLAAPASSAAQDAASYPTAAFGIHWGLDMLTLPRVGQLVERVPDRLRQLPSHPDDVWIYGSRQVLRTIPYDSIEPNPVSTLMAVRAGPEVSLRRLRLRTGLSFAFMRRIEPGLVKANTGATRLVNQRDLPFRGAGASVVYYNMFPDVSHVPGWFGEVSVDVSRHVAAFAGVGFDHVRLLVETGYDRFDRFEPYDRRVAGLIRVPGAHGGIMARLPLAPGHSVGFRLAVGRLGDTIETNNMTIGTAGRWYASLGVSLQHMLARRD